MNLSDYTGLSWKELLNKISRSWYDLPRLIKELAERLSQGSNITLDSSKFNNNLSQDDNTVQKAFETLDTLAGGGGSNLSTTQTSTSVTINNSGGTDATISLANGTSAGVSINNYTTTEKNKLATIATSATANSSDATLLDRANHTGTQTASTISDFSSAVAATSAVTANTNKVSFPEAPTDGKTYGRKDSAWEEITSGTGAVDSVNGQTGTVVIDADDIGVDADGFSGNLSSADNTVQKALETIDGLDINGGGSNDAVDIDVDASGFSGNLSSADDNVQKALETIDALDISGGGSNDASDIDVDSDGFTGNLSSADDTVQKALETIDGLTIPDVSGKIDVTSGRFTTDLSPSTDDGATIGTSSLGVSDIYLASGGRTYTSGAGHIEKSGNHALTLTTTGTSAITFPSGTKMLASLSDNQTFTGTATFSGTTTVPSTLNFTSNGSIVKSGNHALTLTTTGATNVTFPTSGTLLTTTGSAANLTNFPTLNQNTTGSAATLTTTRTIWGQNFNGSANVTGDLSLGTSSITMTGSIAATGNRVTKGWFTDLEITNAPTIGGTAATGTGGLVRAISPTFTGTPVLPSTITLGANSFIRSGAHNLTFTTTAATNVTLPTSGTLMTTTGNTTGSAATLTTARNLSIGGTSKSFNGSANVTWSTSEIGITKTNIDALSINAAAVGGITVTGTPTEGQVLKATSSTAATWDDESGGGSGINTEFQEETYASSFSYTFDPENPNKFINLAGNITITTSGTVNGDSGMLFLNRASGTETISFGNGIAPTDTNYPTGASDTVELYFIHTETGLQWYLSNPLYTSGATNAENVIVSPSIGGNTDAYSVMDEHEDRIVALESASGGFVNSDIFSKKVLQVADLTDSSGFVNTDDGITGVGTSVNTLNIDFDAIDETKPFRIDVIFTILDASASKFKMLIYKNGISWEGENVLDVYDSKIQMNKSHTAYQGLSAIPDNSVFQFSIIGNGSVVTKSVMPINYAWNGNYATGFEPAFVGQNIVDGQVYNYNPSGSALMYEGLNRINISGDGTNEVIINSVNIAAMDNLDIYEHKDWVATVTEIKVLNDNLDDFYPAYLYAPQNTKRLVQYHHANGTDAHLYGQADFWAKFYNNGNAICFGTFNSYNNPTGTSLWGAGATSSNWGAPAGMVYRKVLMDYCDALLKVDSHIHIGLSMGGYNAMAYVAKYPQKVKGVVSICGALDLTTNFASGTFNPLIDKGYGAMYRCIANSTGNATSNATYWVKIADEGKKPAISEYENSFRDVYNDSYAYVVGDVVFQPYTGAIEGLDKHNIYITPGALPKIPIKLIHGDSDLTIDDAQSGDFKDIIEGLGGDVDYSLVVGADHLGATLFDYDLYIKSWLKGL